MLCIAGYDRTTFICHRYLPCGFFDMNTGIVNGTGCYWSLSRFTFNETITNTNFTDVLD